jgi:membrane-bound ClpP family serine protease
MMRILGQSWFDVNAAWALLAGGLLLIYWELCRPGTVVAGALGGVSVLTAFARFTAEPARPSAIVLFLLGWAVLLAESGRRWPGIGGAALLTGAAVSASVEWYVAAPSSLALAYATAALGSAAIRARVAKRLD